MNIWRMYTQNHNHIDVQCLRYGVRQTEFLSFWGHFLAFYPTPLSYGSWDMEFNGQNFFVIFDHFLLFYFPNNPKN